MKGVFYLSLIAPAMLLKGYVLSRLWSWFIADLFGVRSLTIPEAIGVSMTVGFITYVRRREPEDKRDDFEKAVEAALFALVYPLLILGIGAVIKNFV